MTEEAKRLLGQKMMMVRKEKKLTQKEVAAMFHKERSTISYYETGRVVPCVDFIIEFAAMFQLSLGELLDYENYEREFQIALKTQNEKEKEK